MSKHEKTRLSLKKASSCSNTHSGRSSGIQWPQPSAIPPRTSLTTHRHDSIAAMPRPRPRASKAKDRHGELAAFAQERLVVGDVLRCRPVEIETRPHRARQSVGSEIFLLRFRRYGIRPAAPIAIEEAKVKLLTPKYERLWEIELPVQP